MTPRVVQAGLGATRHVLIVYHLTAELDHALKMAVGGDVCILNLTGKAFSGAYKTVRKFADIIASVAGNVGNFTVGRVVIAGFSEGCQGVRAHLKMGDVPFGVVAADGTHASWPVNDAELTPWREAFARACGDAVDHVFAASHSGLTYVEKLKPPQGPYASTFTVLKRVTGWALTLPKAAEEPVTHNDGYAQVWSCGGTDAKAHIKQATTILPLMLGWVWDRIGPVVDDAVLVLDEADTAPSLGQRCVDWARERLGVHEQPPASNTGPEVRQYLAPCIRRDTGVHLGLTASNWCAAFACATMQACLRGEPAPHGYRAAVVEMVADANQIGTWRPVAVVKAGTWTPEPGDLAIYDRSTPGKPATAWYRHVNRVTEWLGNGVYKAIGGNENDAVREGTHDINKERVLGFIEYPHAETAPPTGLSEAERAEVLAHVALSLDQLAREAVAQCKPPNDDT